MDYCWISVVTYHFSTLVVWRFPVLSFINTPFPLVTTFSEVCYSRWGVKPRNGAWSTWWLCVSLIDFMSCLKPRILNHFGSTTPTRDASCIYIYIYRFRGIPESKKCNNPGGDWYPGSDEELHVVWGRWLHVDGDNFTLNTICRSLVKCYTLSCKIWRHTHTQEAPPKKNHMLLAGGFNLFHMFTSIWGKCPSLTNIFQMAWNHQL